MDHVAIMKKSWGLIPKILSGEKTIESRWYKNKSVPWGKIQKGDKIYFKNSGELVSTRAVISYYVQYSDLTEKKVKSILNKYYKKIGISNDEKKNFFEKIKDKKYCILIFLKNPHKIEPFDINKKGFGMMSAWISVNNINMLK